MSRLFFFWLLIIYAFNSIKFTAPGTIFSFLQGAVVARTARFAFGMNVVVPYIYHNPEHWGRPVFDRADGMVVPHGWDQIVAIVSQIYNWIDLTTLMTVNHRAPG